MVWFFVWALGFTFLGTFFAILSTKGAEQGAVSVRLGRIYEKCLAAVYVTMFATMFLLPRVDVALFDFIG